MVHLPAPSGARSSPGVRALGAGSAIWPRTSRARRRSRPARRVDGGARRLALGAAPATDGSASPSSTSARATPRSWSCPKGRASWSTAGRAEHDDSTWASACSRRFSGTGPCDGLDVVALSHSDSDHAGGLACRAPSLSRWASSGRADGGARRPRTTLLAPCSARARRAGCCAPGSGSGSAVRCVTVLNPDGRVQTRTPTTIRWCCGSTGAASRCSSPGDLGWPGRGARAGAWQRRCALSVLKVAHHGSRFSSSAAVPRARRGRRFAVISVGARNPFRHPTPGGARPARGGRGPGLPHRSRRRGHPRDRRRALWVTRGPEASRRSSISIPSR